MKTKRTISNISYNTPDYFEKVVNDLASRHIIEWCYWVNHEPDVDELKPHIHFVLKPSASLDTFDLRHAFMQFDPNNPQLPLTCTMMWRFTSEAHMDDWLLYAVHDAAYLASKGQKRNKHYTFDDLKSTDPDALRASWFSIDRTKFSRIAQFLDLVNKGTAWVDIVSSGIFPMSQYNAFHDLYKQQKITSFSGRKQSHEQNWKYIDADGIINEVPAGLILSDDDEEISGQFELDVKPKK